MGYGHGDSSSETFIWDATKGMHELDQVRTGLGLDLTGWALTDATGISADGQTIVGTGQGPNGAEAWLAVIPACADGRDKGGDGLADADDPGCTDAADLDEHDPTLLCDDGADNDRDGKADFLAAGGGDLGCVSPISVRASPKCQDGLNNDGDADPECIGKTSKRRETSGGCGLGAELVLVMPLLGLVASRRRRAS